jgi:uncharacterized protein YidB (DUF937 family)
LKRDLPKAVDDLAPDGKIPSADDASPTTSSAPTNEGNSSIV